MKLLKPKSGKVTPEIVSDALSLIGLRPQSPPDTWPQAALDHAYDWAMREHLHASDNLRVLRVARPLWL
jgi:hypothetical protein